MVVPGINLHVIEFRRFRRPQPGFFDPDLRLQDCAGFSPGFEIRFPKMIRSPVQPDCDRRGLLHGDPEADCAEILFRNDLQIRDKIFRYGLHPHGLPDPALRLIEHSAGREPLFAAAFISGVRIIPDTDFQLICARPHKIRNIQREGQVTVTVLPCRLPVHINDAPLVHSTEMQDHPLSVCCFRA